MTNKEFKQARLGLGLTQAQLAEKMGIFNTEISRIESGQRRPTRVQAAFLRELMKQSGVDNTMSVKDL